MDSCVRVMSVLCCRRVHNNGCSQDFLLYRPGMRVRASPRFHCTCPPALLPIPSSSTSNAPPSHNPPSHRLPLAPAGPLYPPNPPPPVLASPKAAPNFSETSLERDDSFVMEARYVITRLSW